MSLQATLRRVHRSAGLIAAPLFLLTAVGAAVLLLRKTGTFPREFVHTMEKLHNLEIIGPYIGFITILTMLFLAVTGIIIFFMILAAKRRAASQTN